MSILIVVVGWVRGEQPRLKVSMMIMRPPQQGQGFERVGGSLPSVASALTGSLRDFGTASNWRARAMLSAREALAPA